MRLGCDLPCRTHAEIGVRLVQRVFAVGGVQNAGLNGGIQEPDLNVYHSNESCTALVGELYRQPHDVRTYSSSFCDIRLPQAGKQMRNTSADHQTYRADDGDVIRGHVSVWDRIVLWSPLINLTVGYSLRWDLPQPMLGTWCQQPPWPWRVRRGV